MTEQEASFTFMLPELITSGLCAKDSKEYAFLEYDREVISSATQIVMNHLSRPNVAISLSTKKRVKIHMEFFAVALSMLSENYPIMCTARKYYRQWLEDSSLFGDLKRQNKYIRRIIKQLSLPFAFRGATKPEVFQGGFFNLLMDILSDYEFLHTKRGRDLELDTWITIFNTSLGVADAAQKFNYGSLLPPESACKLRQKAYDNVFSILILSGISEPSHWKRLQTYCKQWSCSHDFLIVWGNYVSSIFSFLNSRIYSQPMEPPLFISGVYTSDKQITTSHLSYVFHNVLFSIDKDSTTQQPELLGELAGTISKAKDCALGTANSSAKFLAHRFPALGFLKLFGGLLTFSGTLSDGFDGAMSVNIATLIQIYSLFELDGVESSLSRALAYICQRVTPLHMKNTASFIENAVLLYKQNKEILPFLSEFAMSRFQYFVSDAKSTLDSIADPMTALYISSSEVLRSNPAFVDQINATFEKVWTDASAPSFRFRMLCYSESLSVNTLKKIGEVFFPDSFRTLSSDPSNVPFIASCIAFVGGAVRNGPPFTDEIVSSKIIPHILGAVQNIDAKHRDNFDTLVISCLAMISLCIEWCSPIFHWPETLTAFFEFVNFINSELKASSDEGKEPKKVKGAKGSGLWFEKKKKVIESLLASVTSRINVHIPAKDFFSRRLDSSSEVNEDALMKSLGIESAKITYFTVGSDLLLSFIEKADGGDPLAIFCRGSFGRAAWVVSDDYQGSLPTPQLSDQIKPQSLSEAAPLKVEDLPLYGDQIVSVPAVSMIDLENEDQRLRNLYGKDFASWLDWSKYAFYSPFGFKAPYQRPRVVDFLTTMGILDHQNRGDVRPQKDLGAVQKAIKAFDDLFDPSIVMIPIKHVLSSDESLEFNGDKASRSSALLEEFLREIGEPMEVGSEAAKKRELPPMKTSVPMIPLLNSFAAVLSPSMAKDGAGAKAIDSLFESSLIRIIFNETEFDIKWSADAKPKSFVLSIKPGLRGLYHVTQLQCPKKSVSPFAREQVLSAKTIAFDLMICVLESLPSIYKKMSPNYAKSTHSILKELCSEPAVAELAAIASHSFPSFDVVSHK